MTTQDPKEIAILKAGGKILAEVLQLVAAAAKPGISTYELDQLAEREIRKRKASPAFKNYRSRPTDTPYPASLCVSIDDEVVHGIPRKDKILKAGQIVGLDLGVVYQGLFTDSAITVPIGKTDSKALELIEATTLALEKALEQVKPGNHIGDIGFAIEQIAKAAGFSPVKELVGHGVGRSVHEDPEIPCIGKKDAGPEIKLGMVLAIEPMFNIGGWKIVFDEDEWTVRTQDGSLSAHMEHTVIVTENGCEIITKV